MKRVRLPFLVALVAVSAACGGRDASGVVLVLPSPNLAMAAAFVADDLGLYRREGLTVTTRTVAGVGAPNAVLSGSADFTIGSGAPFLRAAARGQRFLAIANLIDKPLVEFVLRRSTAEQRGIVGTLPLGERARRLRGLTVGVQGIGSIVHAWERYVVNAAGLDVEADVRVVPMDPPAMLQGLRSGLIDGFVTSPPFTTQAILAGDAVMLASGATDAEELLPFAYGLVYTRPETCTTRPDACRRMARALAAAVRLIHEAPDLVLEQVLRPRFSEMPEPLLRAAWAQSRAAHAVHINVEERALRNAAAINLKAALAAADGLPASYVGLYTNEFLR